MEFHPFPKIPRLNRDIVITEKIDGTNAAVYIHEDGTITAASKNKFLTPGKQTDNFGFATWVKQNEEELRELGPGVHHGEWWGVGINRGYNLSERRFSLFNTAKWSDDTARPKCCYVVPILYEGPWTEENYTREAPFNQLLFQPEEQLKNLRIFGSKAVPGYMLPEGIVVFHKASQYLFKATVDNDAGHKELQS